jgi:uncharacterized membrane protein (Fun14 family)
MSIDPASLGLQMGGSALLGGAIGFAAKKIAKILAVIVGVELVLFKFLESQGIVQINWERLGGAFAGLAGDAPGQAESLLTTFLSTAGIGLGFAGGFFLGFKRA